VDTRTGIKWQLRNGCDSGSLKWSAVN